MVDATTVFQEEPDRWVRFLRKFYKQEVAELKRDYPNDQQTLFIDWHDIYRWDSEVAYDVRSEPSVMRTVFEHALADSTWGPDTDIEKASVGFFNAGESKTVEEVTGDDVGKLVTVRGQVAKTSAVKPRLTVAHLECESCGFEFDHAQPQHGVSKPSQCPQTDCRSKSFDPIFEDSEWVTHQIIRLKQPPEQADGDEHIDVHCRKDLAGEVTAGDRIDLTGVLKTDFDDLENPIPDYYMIGSGVTLHDSDYEDVDIAAQKDKFEALASGVRGDPYELLVNSIAPGIKGGEKLELVKLAIGLQLFGGWRRDYGDGRSVRGDTHIALIGEAGTGKSSLLEAAKEISPRSGYVSGKNATQAGLTAAAVRDDFGDSEWSLEAGAVVKAHKGLCCIDEVDKVDSDALSSLHTALERQRLEFNKAGIDASLPCHTSVLAGGNPENGEFVDEMETIDQINIGPTLRSRFDLIFTFRERPEYEQDKDMAGHILKMQQLSALSAKDELPEDAEQKATPAVDIPTLRAWVAYAREHVHPVIEDQSKIEDLAEWYAENRETNGDKTMNRRMVPALGRLCEASARVRLSETVEDQDIQRVQMLLTQSLEDLGLVGDTGIDLSHVETGVSKHGRERTRTVRGIIEELQPSETEPVAIENVVDTATSAGFDESKVRQEMKRLCDRNQATRMEQEGHIRVL